MIEIVVLHSPSGALDFFKAASDLSALTGNAPIDDSGTSEEDKARITSLQIELFQLEKAKAMEDKRKYETMARAKKIQETSRFSKFVYGSIEDLDAAELFEMYRELSRIKQEINDRFPTLLHENRVEASGRLQDPPFFQPTWWHSMPSYVAMPPNYSHWAPSQASFHQHP